MTQKRAKGQAAKPKPQPAATPDSPLPPANPLKPQKKLLVVLSVLFGVWLIALLTMYFTTVYHRKAPAGSSTRTAAVVEMRPGASDRPKAPR